MSDETPAPTFDAKAAAAKIDKAREERGGADAVADALKASRPVDAASAAAAIPPKETPGEKKAAGSKKSRVIAAPRRTKGVAKIIEELRKTMQFVTDDAGNLYRYGDTGAWSSLTDQHQRAIALNVDRKSSPTKRSAIIDHLKADTHEHKLKWGRVADSEIPCADGIVDVLTWKVRPHQPENRLERVIPLNWNVSEEQRACPIWMACLDVWFPAKSDGGRRRALQEFFGYICLAHAKYKKALVLYGESDTGKSVPAMVAKLFVGDDYYSSLGVQDMDDPVRRALIKGKALNILTELSADALIADGGFKTLVSTEEPISLNAKYEQPETYISTAKHVIVTNNLPRFNDHTSAMFNRLLLIPFTDILPQADQDRELLEKLKGELAGILQWAAEGARRLVQRKGQWPEVEAAREIMVSYREDMNPMRQFMSERMIRRAQAATPLREIATEFNRWNTGQRGYTVRYIGKLLRECGFKDAIKDVKFKGRCIACIVGWRVVEPIDQPLSVVKSTNEYSPAGIEVMEGAVAGPRDPVGDPLDEVDRDEEIAMRDT